MIVVVDGSGDVASTSLYLGENGAVRQISTNASIFDFIGMFYGVVSSTQGGWTALSSEGRYMGAAAYGDMDRTTNRYYRQLRKIFQSAPDGDVRLNRSLASWPAHMLRRPYTQALIDILGPPIAPEQMWNPDAVLCVEDIRHRPDTQDRLDKAAATQMVFEDALIHIVGNFIRKTGCDRLVLTGGRRSTPQRTCECWSISTRPILAASSNESTRLHFWVPPVPGDCGVTLGAATLCRRRRRGSGPRSSTPFIAGARSRLSESFAALEGAADVDLDRVGDVSGAAGIDAIADSWLSSP